MKDTIGKVYVARDPKVKIGMKIISVSEVHNRSIIKVLWFDMFGWTDKEKKPVELGQDQFMDDTDGGFRYFREAVQEMPPIWLFKIEDVFDPFLPVETKDDDQEFYLETQKTVSHLWNGILIAASAFGAWITIKWIW
jgi:hypothetical protein